jgi:hypothetical protein
MKNKAKTLSDKITEGLNLAFDKLVREKAQANQELIFSENGKNCACKSERFIKILT